MRGSLAPLRMTARARPEARGSARAFRCALLRRLLRCRFSCRALLCSGLLRRSCFLRGLLHGARCLLARVCDVLLDLGVQVLDAQSRCGFAKTLEAVEGALLR